MKKYLLTIACFIVFHINESNAQILRAFAPRYYNASARGSIVYVSNSIVSSSGVGSGSPGTGDVPPAGSTTNNGSTAINIDIDNPAPATKMAFGSTWNYFSSTTAPGNDLFGNTWKQSAYVLTGLWNIGGSPLAGPGKYGFNAAQTTCIPSGIAPVCTPGAGAKHAHRFGWTHD